MTDTEKREQIDSDVPAEASSPAPDPAVETPAGAEGAEAAPVDTADPEAGTSAPPPGDDGKEWYIIHTYSGFENKVMQSLRQRADAYGMGDKIGEILVPTEDVVEIRDGKKYTLKKKFFPGYVLVQMEMSDEAWHVVRSTPKVTGFVGGSQRPLPMTQEEVDRILGQIHVTETKPKPKFDYKVGETVKITDGPFSNFTGVVEEINEDRATLKVMVSIFGRATPVELEFHQVKRPD
ncbi:MAG: transcription termination/antitermination protein NusG [Acidobacteriota bacterium]|nr:transcription termination/antitermination protein NusG [Acidobacteriota bacterium]MDQ7086619.1 transcription termination/antitermination protein NusG [Acidobacteriota bacterium]